MNIDKSKHIEDWLCDCGERGQCGDGKWRWNGTAYEHHHGYPVGHVATKYCPDKKLRFFGNGEYFGDGSGGRVYLGDTVADVMGQVESALQSALEDGEFAETIKICVDAMTDAELDALPEL